MLMMNMEKEKRREAREKCDCRSLCDAALGHPGTSAFALLATSSEGVTGARVLGSQWQLVDGCEARASYI
jgi:hypothetical protein